MDIYQVRSKLNEIIELSSIEFQKQVTSIASSPFIIQLLVEVLYSDKRDNIIQLAAVGINHIVKNRLNNNYQECSSLWSQIQLNLLGHSRINDIKWKFLVIVSKAIEMIMNELEQNILLSDKLNSVVKTLSYKAKALIFQSFLYSETAIQTKSTFFTQNIHDFLEDTFHFIANYHETTQVNEDYLKLQESVLKIILEIVKSIGKHVNFAPIQQLHQKVCKNETLLLTILEQLLFDVNLRNYQSLNKRQYNQSTIKDVIFQSCRVDKVGQQINTIKSLAINILKHCVCGYDEKCSIQEFNFYKHLFFMQNITPLIVDKLIFFSKNIQQHQDKAQLIVSMLSFVNTSCKFNFLLQYFQSKIKQVYYMICVPLLSSSREQMENYHQNYDEFINISKDLFEKVESEKEGTIKNTAGTLLQTYCSTIHGSLLFVIQDCILSIRYNLLGETSQQITEAIQAYSYKPFVESSFTILTVLSYQFQKRQDIIDLLKAQLLSINQLVNLQGLNKTRFLLFLSYIYSMIYPQNGLQSQKFILFAEKQLYSDTCLSKSAAIFFKTCIRLGVESIWFILLQKIQNTHTLQIFLLLKKTIQKNLYDIRPQQIDKLINIIISRLVSEYNICKKESGEGKVIGSEFIYKCLDILQQIIQGKDYLKKHSYLIDSIWHIFDLFEFVQEIQFQDNILRIFNKTIAVQYAVNHSHLLFMKYFQKICQKHGLLGQLKVTYSIFVTKGRQYFLTQEEGQHDLQQFLFTMQESYGLNHHQSTLKFVLSIQHYAISEYNSVLPRDQRFQRLLLDIYQKLKDFKEYLSEETISAIINYLVMAEVYYGGTYSSLIKDHNISIFKGLQGKLFACGLRKLIEKHYNTDSILEYFRYAIRLLHFIKSVFSEPQKPQELNPYLVQFQKIDPFFEICQALQFVKRNVDHQTYDYLLQELSNQISLGEIKDLLSQRLIDKNLRVYKKIKQQPR